MHNMITKEYTTRVEDKLDSIIKDIGSINVVLAAQHETLKEHIRRTEILEREIEPIKKHVAMVHGGMKLIGLLSVIAAIVESIVQVISKGH